jgi:hypothetical protein
MRMKDFLTVVAAEGVAALDLDPASPTRGLPRAGAGHVCALHKPEDV